MITLALALAVSDVRLLDVDGRSRRLFETESARVLVVRGAGPAPAAGDAAVVRLGPELVDESGVAARALGLEKDGDAVLLDARTRKVLMRFPGPGPSAAAPPIPAYADVVPALEKCLTCHAPGRLPPRLDSFERLRAFAGPIRESLETRRMPPVWPDPKHGAFFLPQALSAKEVGDLHAWLSAGMPKDGPDDPLAAARPNPYGLGKPDVVLTAEKPQAIPAQGLLPYRYLPLGKPMDRDRWLRTVRLRPSPSRAVHHASLLFVPKELLAEFQGKEESAWVSVMEKAHRRGTFVIPVGIFQTRGEAAIFVPAGSVPYLEMHYTPSGREETDLPVVELYERRGEGAPKALKPLWIVDTKFVIPPRAAEVEARAEAVVANEALISHLTPHMHYRGKRAKVTAHYPDGRAEVLLSVPHFQFKLFRGAYPLEPPRRVPAGTRLVFEGAFDNSAGNPANPDPEKEVRDGRQAVEEMFHVLVLYADAD